MPNEISSAFRADPTRTLMLRRKYSAALYKRFRKLKGDIRTSLVTNDAFGLRVNIPLSARQFVFQRDPEKVESFLIWLQKQVDDGILEAYFGNQLGSPIENSWANIYIRQAYEKGVNRAQVEMKTAGYLIPETASVATAMQVPFHIDRVGLLYTRNFTSLKGITDEMSKQISIVLAEGMATGKGPVEIANIINDRVDKIGITRARTLARTEVIRSHHMGMVQEMRNWGVVGVKVLAEWVTAGDGRVCSLCKPLDGKVFTLDKVEFMLPKHPQCRCIIIPLDVTDNEKLKRKIEKQAA